MQDTFLAMYRRCGERVGLSEPVAYARRSIVNAYIDSSRRQASHELVTDELPDSSIPPVDLSERDMMWHALSVLPRRQRAVLVLRYYLDLPDQTIADMLRCRRGTVRSLASRALATLRVHPNFAEEPL